MKCIAVIEDNPDNRLLLEAMLEGCFNIVQYESGPSALAGLPSSGADLVLLDISLPGMDGVEVLQRMRAEPSLAHLPAIALTAHAMAGDRERFLAHGFDDYISKPILDDQLLIATIQDLIEKKHSQSQGAPI